MMRDNLVIGVSERNSKNNPNSGAINEPSITKLYSTPFIRRFPVRFTVALICWLDGIGTGSILYLSKYQLSTTPINVIIVVIIAFQIICFMLILRCDLIERQINKQELEARKNRADSSLRAWQ